MKCGSICLAVVALAGSTMAQPPKSCPPPGFDTAGALRGGFDVNWYANGTWYIQQQMPISYLPPDFTYCVAATYKEETSPVWKYDVAVHNHAENSTGQQRAGTKDICGKIVNATAGKLEVAPCFLPPSLAGPYWVVDFSVEEGWALVSGGPPMNTGEGGYCKTGTGTNDSGLWIFTRMQRRDQIKVEKVRAIAQAKGFDLSVLIDVNQSHCSN
eukprot:m.258290 g.258290  ORF g.258290 m.258290 type:complete len:213 (+) comp36392_c0_seq1:101-739(+)